MSLYRLFLLLSGRESGIAMTADLRLFIVAMATVRTLLHLALPPIHLIDSISINLNRLADNDFIPCILPEDCP